MRVPRMRFTVRRMMAAVAIIALAFFDARLTTSLVILSASVVAIRSLLAEPKNRPDVTFPTRAIGSPA